MTLINEHQWIVAGADDFFVFHTKINPYAKFGAFVRRVTCFQLSHLTNKAPVPEKNEGLYAECSMETLDNTYAALEKSELQQQVYMNAGNTARKTASKTPKKQRFDVTSYRALACLFTSIAVMATIMIICIASFSIEIAKLKDKTASVQQLPFNQQMSSLLHQQLQQIQQNVTDAIRAENKQHLNTSIDALHSSLNNQLNMSINQLHQQLSLSIDNHTLQLIEVNSAIEVILSQNISALEFTAEQLLSLHPELLQASSCAALLPTTPSGYYWVSASNGSAVRVYCDMTRSCGGVTGGWVRVGYLDMTNSSHQCPSGFAENSDSNIRTCRRTDTSAGCGSVMMDVPYQYSRVCGRVRAYQVSTTNAFQGRFRPGIDSNYVDGVSLTRGSPRQHIWTFVSGLQDHSGNSYPSLCPCSGGFTSPPAFVGRDYFCESGNPRFVPPAPPNPTVYSDDPLWDGRGCDHGSTCCIFNDPPWFQKQLSNLTTDGIEMRVCTKDGADNILRL